MQHTKYKAGDKVSFLIENSSHVGTIIFVRTDSLFDTHPYLVQCTTLGEYGHCSYESDTPDYDRESRDKYWLKPSDITGKVSKSYIVAFNFGAEYEIFQLKIEAENVAEALCKMAQKYELPVTTGATLGEVCKVLCDTNVAYGVYFLKD
jgi:hypothetical protein